METTIKRCYKKITLILSLIYKTILLSSYIIFNLCAPFLWGKQPLPAVAAVSSDNGMVSAQDRSHHLGGGAPTEEEESVCPL